MVMVACQSYRLRLRWKWSKPSDYHPMVGVMVMVMDIPGGVSINHLADCLMLLYADDTVILAHSPGDLRRKLCILAEYCDPNSLTVNAGKTKIMVFSRGGRRNDSKAQVSTGCPKMICHICFRSTNQTPQPKTMYVKPIES